MVLCKVPQDSAFGVRLVLMDMARRAHDGDGGHATASNIGHCFQ
jgi:hypothetical protein